MTEELKKTVESYDKYVSNVIGEYDKTKVDSSFLDAYIMATKTAAYQEEDIEYALKLSDKLKNIFIPDHIMIQTEGGSFKQLEEYSQEHKVPYDIINQMYDTLLIEAPYILDSFMLYIERDRPRQERFYAPRRPTLMQVTQGYQDLEYDLLDELFVHMPARVGKSQEMTMAMVWHCGRDMEASNLYVTYKEGLGGAFIDGVHEVITDPTYRFADVFPHFSIADTDALNHKIDFGREKKYKSLSGKGLESGLNGEYDAYGWLALDDLYEGIQDALNPDIRRRKQLIFDNNVMKRAKMHCKKIYNGTIWSLDDIFMNRQDFLQNNPKAKNIRYRIIKIPALDPETDESNFDYDYGVGYSTEHYRMERAKFEENDDIASFMAQDQQEPIERDGAVFKQENMHFYKDLPNEEPYRICAAVDVALGGTDYLAMAVAYIYEDESIYIPDVIFNNGDKSVTQPMVLEMLLKHNVGSVYFEANQGGEGYKDDIERSLRELGRRINVKSGWAPVNKRKEQRIWDKSPFIREFNFLDNGKRTAEYRKFLQNVFSFTATGKNKNDDAPDCLATLAFFIEGTWTASIKAINNPLRGRR